MNANRFVFIRRESAWQPSKMSRGVRRSHTSTISKYMNGGDVRPEHAERPSARRSRSWATGSTPMRAGSRRRTPRSIGILTPDMTAPFFGTVLSAFDRVMRENGYHTLISCYGANHGLERANNLRFLLK